MVRFSPRRRRRPRFKKNQASWSPQGDLSSQNPLPGDLNPLKAPSSKEPPLLFAADGRPAPFDQMYRGRSCFLVCSGPSLKDLDLSLLEKRGVLSMGVNNSWLMHRPDLWVCADPPSRFSDVGWKDPHIMKFLPFSHVQTCLRERDGRGQLVRSNKKPLDMPNVWYYVRNDGFNPETYFQDPAISWGTLRKTKDAFGIANSRSVMLSAFRLLHWLGVGTVYLLGCDFKMSLDQEVSPYAFKEFKDDRGRAANNRMYDTLNIRLGGLAKVMESRDMSFRVFNCNPNSGLKCFPHKSYEEALREGALPEDADTQSEGWYKK